MKKLSIRGVKRSYKERHISLALRTHVRDQANLAVIVVQSTLDREGEDLAIIVIWRDRLTIPFWELLSDPLMRSGSIEVVYISIEYPLELLLMQDEQVIETLASHTPQKAFTDSIRLWGMIRCVEDLDATRLRNPSEVHPKLAIIITDEVLRSLSIGGGFPNRYVRSKRRWDIV